MNALGKRIIEALDACQISRRAAVEAAGISPADFQARLEGFLPWRGKELEALARLSALTIDWFLGPSFKGRDR